MVDTLASDGCGLELPCRSASLGITADDIDSFSDLVLTINTSVLSEDPWREFLLKLSAQIDAKHGTLILVPPKTRGQGAMYTPTSTPQSIQEYLDRYLEIDPFVNLPEGQVTALYEYVGQSVIDRSPDVRAWLESIDASHILGVDLRIGSGFEARLRLSRAPGGPPFTHQERRWVEKIIPHLRQALELYQKLESSRSERAVMLDTTEQFAVGTALLDADFRVLKLNEVAASILAEADGLQLVAGRIVLAQAALDKAFRALLTEVRQGQGALRRLFPIERPSGRPEVTAAIQPVPVHDFMHSASTPVIAIFLTDPSRSRVIEGSVVSKLFALTPTEGNIAAALANGLSVSDVAEQLGIAENTVRAHLRSIFPKIGIKRQLQLVNIIHASFPPGISSS